MTEHKEAREAVKDLTDELRRWGSSEHSTLGALPRRLFVRAANALEAAHPTLSGTPEGWRLVPIEPTPQMLSVARGQMVADMLGPHMGPNAENTYRVMIAAAPPPPTAGDASQ